MKNNNKRCLDLIGQRFGRLTVVDRAKNKWLAYIKYQGVQYWLGEFIDKEDAIQARLDAEKKFFGEYQYIGEYA